MKRPEKKSTDKKNRYTEFLENFLLVANEVIHSDLERSCDWLERHEIDNYIKERKDGEPYLDAEAIEDNEDLTVQQVLEIGIHWGKYGIHMGWHESMEELADEYGVEAPDLHGDNKPGVQVVTDPSQLPDEVKEALLEALGGIINPDKKKKGKK